MKPEEHVSVKPYELQNFIIEWTTKNNKKINSSLGFDKVYTMMLYDLRTNPALWIEGSPMHTKVVDFLAQNGFIKANDDQFSVQTSPIKNDSAETLAKYKQTIDRYASRKINSGKKTSITSSDK